MGACCRCSAVACSAPAQHCVVQPAAHRASLLLLQAAAWCVWQHTQCLTRARRDNGTRADGGLRRNRQIGKWPHGGAFFGRRALAQNSTRRCVQSTRQYLPPQASKKMSVTSVAASMALSTSTLAVLRSRRPRPRWHRRACARLCVRTQASTSAASTSTPDPSSQAAGERPKGGKVLEVEETGSFYGAAESIREKDQAKLGVWSEGRACSAACLKASVSAPTSFL